MNFVQKTASAATLALASVGAFAAGPTAGDLSSMTPDLTSIITAVGAIGAAFIGVKLAIKGYHVVSALFNRG